MLFHVVSRMVGTAELNFYSCEEIYGWTQPVAAESPRFAKAWHSWHLWHMWCPTVWPVRYQRRTGRPPVIDQKALDMSDLTKTLPPLTQFCQIFLKKTGALRAQLHGRPTSGTFRRHGSTLKTPPTTTLPTAVRRSLCRQAELCGALEPVHSNGSSLSHWDIAVLFIYCNATNSL